MRRWCARAGEWNTSLKKVKKARINTCVVFLTHLDVDLTVLSCIIVRIPTLKISNSRLSVRQMSNVTFYMQAVTVSLREILDMLQESFWNFGRPFMVLKTLHCFRAFQKCWCWCTWVHVHANNNPDQSCIQALLKLFHWFLWGCIEFLSRYLQVSALVSVFFKAPNARWCSKN